MIIPEPGSVWKHYKGNLYVIERIAYDATETHMLAMVIYRELAPEPATSVTYWVRSLANWHARIGDTNRFTPHG